MRKYLSNRMLQLVLIGLTAAGGFWVGHKLDLAVERRSIVEQFDLDGHHLLSRLELVIDQSHHELKKLQKVKLESCSPSALKAAGQTIFGRGTLKVITVRDANGNLMCSTGNHNFGEPAGLNLSRSFEQPDTKGEIFIGVAENQAEGLLQLRKPVSKVASLYVSVGLDSLLYSFFDPAVRNMASVGIYFDMTKPVATYGEIQSIGKEAGGFDRVLNSRRFPLSVRLSVPESSIQHLAAERQNLTEWLMAIAGCLLAGLGTVLGISIFTRAPDPVKILSAAIQRGEIVPYYQPIIKLSDNSISGCEILVRWLKPDGTMVRPDLFIPLAETSGLIADMTLRTLKTAVSDLMPIMRAQKQFKLAINVSPDHFSSEGFLDSILKVLDEASIHPSQIVLELTERQQLQDLEAFKAIADAVQNAGLRISIDDVGTGHNGLSTIQDVPADIIKIDKKFVDTVVSSDLSAAIVAMLVGLTKKFERVVVAEGIESQDQLEALIAQGVDEGQGYLFSPALNAMRFTAFYGAHSNKSKSKPSSKHSKLKVAA